MRVEPPDGWRHLVLTAVSGTLGPDMVIDDMMPLWVPRIATTLGVYRATGHVTVDGTTKSIDVIVKCVACFNEGSAPEATFYASAAPAGLPTGLDTPRCFGIIDLNDRTTAIVLEHVREQEPADVADRTARIAHLLGQLAGSGQSTFAAYAATRPGRRLLDAYIDGLRTRRGDIDGVDIRRGYAIQLGAGVTLLESIRTLQMVTGALDRDSVEARYGAPLPAILARRSALLHLALNSLDLNS